MLKSIALPSEGPAIAAINLEEAAAALRSPFVIITHEAAAALVPRVAATTIGNPSSEHCRIQLFVP